MASTVGTTIELGNSDNLYMSYTDFTAHTGTEVNCRDWTSDYDSNLSFEV